MLSPSFSFSGSWRFYGASLFFVLATLTAQAAPVAPSNLRGAMLTSNSFEIIWDDNSTDETSFEMVYSVNDFAQPNYPLASSNNTGTIGTGFSGLSGWLTATIQIRATNGSGSSSLSNPVTLTFSSAFNRPNGRLAKVLPNGSILIMWTDNAYTEAGYLVEWAPTDSGPWLPAGNTAANYTGLLLDPLPPATTYHFRIKAYQGPLANPTAISEPTPSPVSATTPATLANPTGLVVTPIAPTETSANFAFSDNTGLNNGYEYEEKSNGATSFSFLAESGDGASINGPGLLDPGTAYVFRCRAFYDYGNTSPRAYSPGYSNEATLTTPFFAPTSLTATPAPSGNGNINLTWVDNSLAEGAYAIYIRKSGVGDFVLWDYTADDNTTTYAVSELEPGTAYDFQVAAAYQSTQTSPVIYSGRSNSATATTPSTLLTPSGLAASALLPNTESSIKLTWTDNTTLNVGYEIEGKLTESTGGFVYLEDAADGTVFNMPNSYEPGTSYQFRVRAFYQQGANSRVYSDPSLPTTYITPFHAPTAPTATVASDTQVNLTWVNNSVVKEAFSIYFRLSGTTEYFFYDLAPASATSFNATGLFSGAAYDFQIRSAFYSDGRELLIESNPTTTVSATTKDGFTSSPLVTFRPDGTYAYTATTSSTASTRTSWSAPSLPAGLSFNTTTGAITGTPTEFGEKTGSLSATFSDGRTTTLSLTFRIVRPPAPPLVGATITGQTLTLGGSDTSIPLTDKFSDPDSESAVRVITNLGTMDFILYNAATPQTVINFRDNYVNLPPANNYNGSVFHRSVPGFVVQGGAFKVLGAPNNFSINPTASPVLNEPGISNLRGTVAMAKQGGDPDSATNQFFVNLADNSGNLDSQNGGFTAFARVANGGMAVADAIAGLPTGTYNVNLGTTATSMEGWPLTSASAAMDITKVVTMTSVAPVAVLSYSIFANTNPTAVQATLDGINLVTHALSGGQSNITIRATDLDGNYVDQTFTVTVNASANAWATSQGLSGNDALPDADPDFDGLSNFHEFAFMSHPNASSSSGRPSFATTPGATKYGEITFPVRKFTTGLTYIVEASSTLLPGSWTTVLWTSTDGFAAANVIAAVDQADCTMVTIRDTAPSPPADRRFLRVRVTAP